MPLGKGVRYRVKKTKKGKKVRLAFRGNKVIEAKNLQSGATHTPQEFAADRRGASKAASKPAKVSRRKSLKQLFPG
jgi:hypothetical protein